MYNFAVSMCIYRRQTIRQIFYKLISLKHQAYIHTSQRKHLSHKTLFQSHVHQLNTEHEELVFPKLIDFFFLEKEKYF